MAKNKRALKISPGIGYSDLVKKIKAEFSTLEELFKKLSAQCYWKVGEHIHKHLLQNKARADYGKYFYDMLEEDTGREKSTFQRTVQFYRTYPIIAASRQLTWSHYCELMTVRDENQRKKLEEKVVQNNWTNRQLREYLSQKRLAENLKFGPDKPVPQLSVTRSRLFTYKVVEPSYIHPVEGKMIIDLGFDVCVHTEIKGLRLKDGEVISSKKIGGSADVGGGESAKSNDTYSFKRSDATPKELYTYKALVERVVDADTFVLDVDLGFSSWIRGKFRLRGIDCPELSTPEGKKAKAFVEARLKEVNFIVIKTHKNEKYGRTLADVFYLPAGQAGLKGEDDPQVVLEKGVFLNQELLDNHLAVLI